MFKNSEKRNTSDTKKLVLNFTDKINLKINDKYIALSNPSIYYTRKKNRKKSYRNISYQKTFKINKTENRITFKIKTGYNFSF